jgi:hypothetical protein
VAGRVDERDLPAVVVDLVRPDVLRDAAELLGHDVRLANGVEKERLSVVDVAHHRHHRWTGGQTALVDLFFLCLLLFLHADDLRLEAELGGQQLDRVVRE